jgi:electron transfer flavoprotein alpha subunit
MISVNPKGEVWVFAEQHEGRLEDIGLELIGRARILGDKLGVKVGAVLIGDEVKSLAEKLCHYGADKVYLLEHPLLEHYQANSYGKVIDELIHKYQPQIMIYGATACGRDLAPRVASAIKAGLTADCTDLQIGDHETKDKMYKNLLLQIRPLSAEILSRRL